MWHWLFIGMLSVLPDQRGRVTDSIVQLTVPDVMLSGNKGSIRVRVTIKEGYHIQANDVQGEFIIPTTVEIRGEDILVTGKPSFPASKKLNLGGSGEYLDVYDGHFEVAVPFRTKKSLPPGEYVLDGRLRYQACDDKRCFPPRVINFPVLLKVP